MKINNKKIKRVRGEPVYSNPNPEGTRHMRRKEVAVKRLQPEWDRLNKINRIIKETKEIGRGVKAKHIEEVKLKTEERNNLKKYQ